MLTNFKKIIKKNKTLDKLIYSAYRLIKGIPRMLGYYKASKMLKGELHLFHMIYIQCKIIVDIGARFDIDYVLISQGNGIRYFIFEPNPKFYKKLISKLKPFKEDIIPENLAIGERNGFTYYYEDSESVLQNTTAIKDSKKKIKKSLKMIRLDDYLRNKSVEFIDFLKIDIEEYDYFGLVGLGNYIDKCKFIQFELGIGAPLGIGFVTNQDYYNLLETYYNLYLIKDENNPLWMKGFASTDLISIDDLSKKMITQAQLTGVGFNILCVNKVLATNISLLSQSFISQEVYEKNIFQ